MPSRAQSLPSTVKPSRAVWICYAAGAFAYIVAVFNRTSFGVAAVPAADRFHASASDIAMFTVAQLIVYAVMQVPVGVMIDRYGPRRLVIAGALMMALGQAALALATSVTPALLARVLIGAGDAFTFTCVLRMVAEVFPPRMVPQVTQLTGLLGQIGQLLSAVPFAALLGASSWTVSFLVVAAHGVLSGVLAIALFRGGAVPAEGAQQPGAGEIGRRLASAWRHPGTKLGFWSHFVTMFSVTNFTMLWGYPFMTVGLGFSQQTASAMLTINVIVAIISSPIMGRLVSRHPLRRSAIVLGCAVAAAAGWTLVLLWPGAAPPWTIAVLMVAISIGGPGSMVGFDFARTFNPTSRLGTATGLVNIGGFAASLITMYAMGVILDQLGDPRADHSLGDFEWAFAFQYLMWVLGIVMIVRNRNRTRRLLAREEDIVVPPLSQAVRRDWLRYRAKRAGRVRQSGGSGSRVASDPDTTEQNPPDWQI